MKRFSTALLDIDGTLLLSNDAHARAWRDALREFGFDIPLERLRRLIGMGSEKLLPAIDPTLRPDREPGTSIVKRRTKLFLEHWLPTLQPAPGARDFLLRLRACGIARIVATSAKAEELTALLRAARIDDLIEGSTTSDDADRSKPDPDIVEAALQTAGVDAKEAVLIGDTPYDLQAAQRAEVAMIGVRCGGWSDEALKGAIALYDDPAHLVQAFSSSPLAENER